MLEGELNDTHFERPRDQTDHMSSCFAAHDDHFD